MIGILSSVVSAYYYLRVLVYAYMKEETTTFPSFKFASSIVLIVLCIGTLVLGVFPFDSWDLALEAAGSVLLVFKGG